METLEQLKEVIDGAVEGDLFYDGRYLNEKLHVRGLIDKYSVKGVKSQVVYDAPLYVNTGKLRSLSDIKLIIESMEDNKKAKKGALLSLKEAIEPDDSITNFVILKTIRTIQEAIDKIVSHL